jgi:hypothetical protein
LLGAGVGQRATNVLGQRGEQHPNRFVADDLTVLDRADLLAAQRVAEHPQTLLGDLRSATDALLDAEQHLHDHPCRQCSQVHLPGLGHARFDGLPPALIQLGVGSLDRAPALIVGIAIAARTVRRPGAGRHLARRHRRERSHPRIGQELLQRPPWPPEAELLGVRLAQHRMPHRRHALASRHRAALRPRGVPRQLGSIGDLLGAHAQPGQPGETPVTHHAEPAVGGALAPVGPADPPAQQPMLCGWRQHPHRRVPPRLIQEVALHHRGQARRRAIQPDPAQHVRELARILGDRDGTLHGGAHWPIPG